MDGYLEQARAVVHDAVRGMTDEQLTAPRGGKWSAAQIVEHLALAFGATAAGFERVATAEKVEVRRATMRERFASLVVVRFGYIPTGRTAPEMTVPAGVPPQQALQQLDQNLAKMDAAIARVERKWGDRIVAVHPVIGPLTAKQWRKFHMVHARHHARQILAIKAAGQGSAKAAA